MTPPFESLVSEIENLKSQLAAFEQRLSMMQFLTELPGGGRGPGVMPEPVLGGQEPQRYVPQGGCSMPPGEDGDILYWDHTDSFWKVLNIGTAGQKLRVNGTADAPEWVDDSSSDYSRGDELMPSGSAGALLYHNGSVWVTLAAPTGFTNNPVLRFTGSAPYWDEPSACP